MIFKRKIYDKLVEWNNSSINDSALLIEGARRIGKTTIVTEFAKEYYKDNYLYIDFKIANDDLKDLFNDLRNMDIFFEKLFLFSGKGISKGGLVIFDEVQFCPKAREAIKYLVLDGRFRYIETGSLISIKENTVGIQIPSEERKVDMYPMDFEEYLWANNDTYTAEFLRNVYNNQKTIDDKIHKELMQKFRRYLAIGGMPKVLSVFLTTNSYYEAELIKKNILSLYKDDLRKHDMKYNTSCEIIFDAIPYQLSKESTRFFVSSVTKDKRAEQLEKTLFDLEYYKLVNIVYNFKDVSSFFELSKINGLFKIYCVDTGLLVTSLLKGVENNITEAYKKIIVGEFDYNFGAIFESICSQMLIARGIKPYYHTFTHEVDGKEKSFEIDFMFQNNFKTYALEVKSTKRFETSSLNVLKDKYKQVKIKRMVASTKTLDFKKEYINIPIYMVPFADFS